MKRFFLISLLLLFAVSTYATDDPVDSIIETIKKNKNKFPGNRIAVIEFTSIDGSTNIKGKLISEQLISKLTTIKGLKVIERKQLKQILQEQELIAAGLLTGDTSKIGDLESADVLLTGTIAELDNDEDINAKVISVKSGEIICAANIKMKKNKIQQKILKDLKGKERKRYISALNNEKRFKKENPEAFKALVEHRKQLLKLREKNPDLFRKIIITIRSIDHLKRTRPRLFLLVTAPQNKRTARYLNNLKRKDYKSYTKVMKLRKGLKFIVDKSPAYKKKIVFDRLLIMKRIKNGRN